MPTSEQKAYGAALKWYQDQGVDVALRNEPVDRTALKAVAPAATALSSSPSSPQNILHNIESGEKKKGREKSSVSVAQGPSAPQLLGKSDSYAEAVRLAKEANSYEELQAAILEFDGLAIKKTATNMVFCDGNPEADVMLVGEAPGADEDRQGKPFVGVSGQLLDRILKCIDLDRTADDPTKSIYISNILNWRPPGNRTPSPAEIEVSLPFIEKHIGLKKPKVLILCGGVAAKALLGSGESVSKLRKAGWHDYNPLSTALGLDMAPIPAIATYHPAYLLRTPTQKKAVWHDMLKVQIKHAEQ